MAANATAIWRARPSGSNTNGGGYDSGIASAGTDRSQQDAAYLSNIGTVTTATVTLTDSGASFTTDLIGNGIYVAGTSITTTYTFITGVPSSTTLTLQTSPGAAGTAVTYHIGGGWADFWTNNDTSGNFASSTFVVAGNTIYVLGSGVPNPSSYTYDYTLTNYFTPVAGNQTTGGLVRIIGDPATPSSGIPVIKVPGLSIFATGGGINLQNLCLVASGAANANDGVVNLQTTGLTSSLIGVVFDQFGYDIGLTSTTTNPSAICLFGCEIFSSVAKRTTNAHYAAGTGQIGMTISNCNIHDCIGPGISLAAGTNASIVGCIIAKNGGAGISVVDPLNADNAQVITNNTIDANTGSGIVLTTQLQVATTIIYNNIISNHVTAATYGLSVGAGAAAANSRVQNFINYNTFYNNTQNYNNINAGVNDTATGSNPYIAQSTENYTLI